MGVLQGALKFSGGPSRKGAEVVSRNEQGSSRVEMRTSKSVGAFWNSQCQEHASGVS